jgi:hypothetical protein
MRHTLIPSMVCLAVAGCGSPSPSSAPDNSGRFAADVAFLRQHTNILILSSGPAQVAVAPGYQGRVMTSTTGGPDAPSFGWIGRSAVEAGTRQPHMNVFGGEDRFWLGPEGGQYALYFKPGDPFDLDHWDVPEAIDWGAWEAINPTAASVSFRKRMDLQNYAGTRFTIDVDRTVRLLNDDDVRRQLGLTPAGVVRTVAFESSNTVTNSGAAAWQPKSGLVSVWILGQFTPSPDTTVAIPFAPGPESTIGPIVNDAYFGKVPADRLTIEDGVILFKADGRYRSKIGLPPPRALATAGSYDASAHVLTIVQYTRPPDAREYVNSMWEVQREPFKGDVVNSYNDGPPAPGKPPLGPFYELETSSPALALTPGQRYTHVHRTFHFAGPEPDLDAIARATLKIGIEEVKGAFGRR